MKKSFPFEYEAFIAGTAFFNRREKGAYIDLLCCQAGKGRMTLQDIKDILNGDFEDCWPKLKSKYIEENGVYYNKKLESVKQGNHKKTEVEIAGCKEKIEQQLKEKKLKFYEDCKPYLSKYPKEMLRQFYNYWTEMNKSGTKVRFELQQTFEISKRLATWANKDKEDKQLKKYSNIPPTFEEVKLRIEERQITSFTPELFFSKYETNGWMVGKNKMKNWDSALTYWTKNNFNGNGIVTKSSRSNGERTNSHWN